MKNFNFVSYNYRHCRLILTFSEFQNFIYYLIDSNFYYELYFSFYLFHQYVFYFIERFVLPFESTRQG